MNWRIFAFGLGALGCKEQPRSEPPPAPPPTAPAPVTPTAAPTRTYAFCHADRWCWAHPAIGGSDLNAVVALSANDVWVAGDWGTVLHWNGKAWAAESVGEAALTRIWPAPGGDVWVIGEGGFVARRDATGWKRIAANTDRDLLGIDGLAADAVWIAGKSGTVLHWNGQELARPPGSFSDGLYAVDALASDAIWMGGYGLYRYDGKTTKRDDSLGLSFLLDIRALGRDDVWAVDDIGRVVHWNGARWSVASAAGEIAETTSDDVELVYADNHQDRPRFSGTEDDLWLTGGSRALQRRDGRWRNMFRFPNWTRASTYVDRATGFVGVGAGGRIFRGRDGAWTYDVPASDFDIRGLAQLGDGTLLAGGTDGLARLDGAQLVKLPHAGPVHALFARSANDIFTAGSNGVVSHFDGTTWSKTTVAPGVSLRGMWMGAKDGWVVGDGGTIARWDGGAWKLVPSGTTAYLHDVWAASPTDAWATGSERKDGILLHWDGTAWSTVRRFEGTRLYALAGVDATHAWIATDKDLLAWDGTTWSTAPGWTAGSPGHLVAARAPDDVWAASEKAVHHFDGKTWQTTPLGLRRVASLLASEHAVWLGGEHGALLVKER